jgi:signal transduction histidine kinase
MSELLNFKISSGLKDIIGKDLINNDFIAIFELVKNSFDASAENVNILFHADDMYVKKIFISDDGKGMSKTDIINKWLFVAFSAKKNNTENAKKKIYSGYKGIGRFSCDRLGKSLKIYSATKSSSTIHCITVNWDDFEQNSQKEFIDIAVQYSEEKQISIPDEIQLGPQGVVLEIGELRDETSWDREKLLKLRWSLQKLIDPINSHNIISIYCKRELTEDLRQKSITDRNKREPMIVNGKIDNNILKNIKNKTTMICCKIVEHVLVTELIDRGIFIYKTEENIETNYPELIDSDFYLELSFVNRSTKIVFKNVMNISFIEYGSLFLIRNGFRVNPIGDENNDYWGFDRRKQQGYARYLGSRDLLGFVKISGNENKFREASSRNQGVIENNASIQLQSCVRNCLFKLEAYVVDITWKDKLDSLNEKFERMGLDANRYHIIELIEQLSNSKNIKVIDYNHDLISILNEKAIEFEPSLNKLKTIANKLNDENLIKQISTAEKQFIKAKIKEQEALKLATQEQEARKKSEEIARNEKARASREEEEKEKVKKAYSEEVKRNLFLTGSGSRDKELLECFIHQIILYASQSKEALKSVLENKKILHSSDTVFFQDLLSSLYEINEQIISTSRFATTANFRLKSSMIKEDINKFLTEYLEKISAAYNTRIQIHTHFDTKPFELLFNPIEIGMVMENFISNSKKARASNISFTSSLNMNVLQISIEDNGTGIDTSINDTNRIFEKGFTRTDGSGLGLYFCKTKIEALGGEVKVAQEQPVHGAKFIIKVVRNENRI